MKLEVFVWLLAHILTISSILIFRNQFSLTNSLMIIAFILLILGTIVLFISLINLGKYYTPSPIPKGLVTKGIYSKVRHPIYLSLEILFIGLSLLFKSLVGLLLTVLLIIPFHLYRKRKEEKLMLEKFGKQYIEYKKRTWF